MSNMCWGLISVDTCLTPQIGAPVFSSSHRHTSYTTSNNGTCSNFSK
ncbi:hypothetical protein MtrunA17_Chr7g0219941 [Medicago truncatula]|uniref:Uncharacterized protein n=1 Tax=Medicago truncatula TaxID=3880 RepID=A0A396H051_MEDTR|nr:hypothetical protein MtrunA17_Chr7g0219941 [Medicago truncatula]